MKQDPLRAQLDVLRRELQLVGSMFDAKIAWLNVISQNKLHCDFTVTDNTIAPPTVVRRILFTSAQLRAMTADLMQEARRAFLNDLYLVASRHAMIVANLLRNTPEPRPEFSPERRDAALNALNRYLSKSDKRLLDFFRRFRNSLVHYEGRHNKANPLDFILLGRRIATTDTNLGEGIEMSMDQVYHLFDEVLRVFSVQLLDHPHFRREREA